MTAPTKAFRGRRLRAALAMPALLLLLSIGFYWKLTLSRDYVWFDQPDMAYIELPRVGFQARAIHSGRFPLWDPNIWVGQPLIGQTQPGPLYPLNLLLCLMPLANGYVQFAALNWHYVLMRFVAALFCYWLCRDLRLSRGASVLAGCAFGFSGFLGSVAWLDVANGALTTPLVFLFLFRAVRGESPARNAALSGLFLGVAWLSGHHEIPMLVSIAVAATWAWHAIEPVLVGRRPDWQRVRLGAFSLAVAGLIGAVQMWPTWEFGRLAVRWVGTPEPVDWKQAVPYTIHTVYSLPARGLLATVLPVQARYADSSAFLGAIVAALAALGLLANWDDRRVRWFGALAAASVLYALGAFTPLHGLFYSLVPGMEKARVPVRAVHLFTFAFAVLAAYGVDVLWRAPARLWVRWVRRAATGFGLLVVAVGLVFGITGKGEIDEKVLLGGFLALAFAAALAAAERGRLGSRAGAALLTGLMLADIYGVATWTMPHRLDEGHNKFSNALRENFDVAAFLRAQPRPLRVVVDDNDVPTNFGDWHGIEMLQGYVAGVPANLLRLALHTPRTQSLLGVGYRVSRKPARAEEADLFAGAGGIHVYRVPDAMPRAWIVHRAETAANPEEMRRKVEDANFDFSRAAVLLGPAPALAECASDNAVVWYSRGTDRLKLTAHTDCRGMLVVGDSYYPGWTAQVDGREAPVLEVWGALRGVVLEPGSHVVEMKYRPVSVLGGACLTGIGLLIAAVVAWRGRRPAAA